MHSSRTLWLLLIALLILCFGLGASVQPRFQAIENSTGQSDNFFIRLFGDSSRIFANAAFTKADAYYHSGYYPTIFDNNQAFETPHMAEDTGAVASHNQGEETAFMGPPRDWLDAFARRFIPNRHTHLDEGGPADDLSSSSEVREILPWLDLATELNPNDIRTYLVISFWLRTDLNQAPEAEHVLRGGLRANPRNPQLLFELGRIYFDNYHEPDRARTIWEAGLRAWALEKPGVPESERLAYNNGNSANFDDRFVFEQLQVHLAQLEGSLGNIKAAIDHLQQAELAAPDSSGLQKMIDELKNKRLE
jgi:tetratricopeptide (TPR) repeat protein